MTAEIPTMKEHRLARVAEVVREVASELNKRIVQWRRFPSGPPVFVPLVDTDAMVDRWREAHKPKTQDPGSSAADIRRERAAPPAGNSARYRRWFRRRTVR